MDDDFDDFGGFESAEVPAGAPQQQQVPAWAVMPPSAGGRDEGTSDFVPLSPCRGSSPARWRDNQGPMVPADPDGSWARAQHDQSLHMRTEDVQGQGLDVEYRNQTLTTKLPTSGVRTVSPARSDRPERPDRLREDSAERRRKHNERAAAADKLREEVEDAEKGREQAEKEAREAEAEAKAERERRRSGDKAAQAARLATAEMEAQLKLAREQLALQQKNAQDAAKRHAEEIGALEQATKLSLSTLTQQFQEAQNTALLRQEEEVTARCVKALNDLAKAHAEQMAQQRKEFERERKRAKEEAEQRNAETREALLKQFQERLDLLTQQQKENFKRDMGVMIKEERDEWKKEAEKWGEEAQKQAAATVNAMATSLRTELAMDLKDVAGKLDKTVREHIDKAHEGFTQRIEEAHLKLAELYSEAVKKGVELVKQHLQAREQAYASVHQKQVCAVETMLKATSKQLASLATCENLPSSSD